MVGTWEPGATIWPKTALPRKGCWGRDLATGKRPYFKDQHLRTLSTQTTCLLLCRMVYHGRECRAVVLLCTTCSFLDDAKVQEGSSDLMDSRSS